MRKLMLSVSVAALATAFMTAAPAQEKTPAAAKSPEASTAKTHASNVRAKAAAHVEMNSGDVQWADAPPSLPRGAKLAVLQGDPGKPGPFTVRVKAGDGYRVAPHWHPTTEHVTVLSGTFNVGVGDKFDESKGKALAAGGFSSMPARMHHYAWFKGDTEIQVNGMGPFKLIYVNPADDPRKAAKSEKTGRTPEKS